MQLVAVEHLFGGDRIIYYFMSEGRVDFRELVKELAHEYQTRIEMRQVGARDEARLVADFETCGRECCCKNFLKVLQPINMRMAKVQKATLDPSKISGRCGRLKCCLRFEDEVYTELSKKMPRVNSWVLTASGAGQILDIQILTQLVRIRLESGRIMAIPVEEIQQRDYKPREVAAEPAGRPGRPAAPVAPKPQPQPQQAAPQEAAGAEGGEPGKKKKRRRRRKKKKGAEGGVVSADGVPVEGGAPAGEGSAVSSSAGEAGVEAEDQDDAEGGEEEAGSET
jgi:hypothetical protein